MKNTWIVIMAAVAVTSCTTEIPTVNLGIDDVYYVYRMQKLPLESALTGAAYRWTVNGMEVSDTRDYIFLAEDEGVYNLTFEIIDEATPYHFDFTVNVLHEEVEYSPYISRVYEYCPAPGQFINEMPRYEDGDTYTDMLRKVEESISGTNDVMVSLGGFGGYVTFGFDHTVVNKPGQYDFRIWGNAFYELTDPEHPGGSAEPGIVMVSYDANCNGQPDDPFYELAGSEYHKPETTHGYTVTYRAPDAGHEPVDGNDGYIIDTEYIAWSASDGGSGYMSRNRFHTQSYWPMWNDDATMSFSGTRLADNGVDTSGTGRYYILYCYGWGYADNHPNDYADQNSFDIGWAVDAYGRAVTLPGADFVRVYTGLNQQCGWLGETSTEISRAQDLHITPIN